MTGHDVGPCEQKTAIGVDNLSWNRRLASVGTVSEKSQNKETKQKDQDHCLNPASGQEKPAFSRRFHTLFDSVLRRSYASPVDITEQEQMTQELRRREAYRAQAEALSHTGSLGWNVSTDLYWSDETHQILEYKRTIKPTLELLFRRVHPVGIEDSIPQDKQIPV